MHAIDRIFTKWPCFGYRSVTATLREQGYLVNEKRVLRLMRKMGLYAIFPVQILASVIKDIMSIHIYLETLKSHVLTKCEALISPIFQ